MEKREIGIFQQANKDMIATNDKAWDTSFVKNYRGKTYTYTDEEIERIIERGSVSERLLLSRTYFLQNGFYKRIIMHYATILKYTGLLIPNPAPGKSLSTEFIQKRYHNAIDFVDKLKLNSFFINASLKVLSEGAYYGAIKEVTKNKFAVIDLPTEYCRTRFKDYDGNDLVEFNVLYFNTISNKTDRDIMLSAYPEVISNYYKQYRKKKTIDPWVFLPSDIGICFCFSNPNNGPILLNIIPAANNYDDTVGIEKERNLEEIRKILVQKVPHLNDGQLLFEPPEAAEMHQGSVNMLKGNKNTSVLTTYNDVTAIMSKTSAETNNNSLEKAANNIYYEAGTSQQIFGSDSNLSLEYALDNDVAFMAPLICKYDNFVTNLVNRFYSNSNIQFSYKILPITFYNYMKFFDSALKAANSGFSFLMPALALGISQKELGNLKDLENNVLKLGEKLIPLTTSYTMSSDAQGGAPIKEGIDKSPKTEQNQESLNQN